MGCARSSTLEPDARPDEPIDAARDDAPRENRAPVARVRDTEATVGERVEVSGADSADPEGAALRFAWSFSRRPAGSVASLEAPSAPVATFVADVPGEFMLDLVVDDGVQVSAPATARVVATEPPPPIARAGEDVTSLLGRPVTLDGSGSSDPTGLPLTFEWTLTTQPAGGAATLLEADRALARLRPDVLGEHLITLVVTNGRTRSAPDVVRVTAVDVTAFPGDVRRGVFATGEVYLAGTVSPGACYEDALAHPSAPSVAAVGFDCHWDRRSAVIAPDGTLLYRHHGEHVLREFHCDGCPDWSPGDAYPAAPLANDTIRPTPPCDPETDRLSEFLVSPEGAVLHRCRGIVWYDESGREVVRRLDLLSLGRGGVALMQERGRFFVLELATDAATAVAGLPDCPIAATRAGATSGFVLALHCPAADELWSIAVDGLATPEGAFPPPPPGYRLVRFDALASDGALWSFAGGPITTEDAIVRRTIDGASELVYSEEMVPAPAVLMHISDLVTGP